MYAWVWKVCNVVLPAAVLILALPGRLAVAQNDEESVEDARREASSAIPSLPNIVFILIDDMGARDIGCFGSTLHETPNIDRLAREGMRFTQAYAAAHVCSPTRASILTGRHPARLRLTNFLKGRRSPKNSPVATAPYADQLPLGETTLAEVLKTKGYATAHVGKWHLGGPRFRPEAQGFDVNVGGTASGMPRSFFWPKWQKNPPVVGAFTNEYLPDRLSQEACRFIETHRKQPFFLYLSHYSVHIPIEAKADKIERYKDKLQQTPAAPGTQNNPHYAAMVESIDESVGRVMATLERFGLEKNTIVVFFSDNGGLSTPEGRHTPATTNQPLRAGKGYLYEGGIREPCIIRWPEVVPPGSVRAEPVVSTDFFPTFCDVVGVDPVAVAPSGGVDGESLLPLLQGKTPALQRDALYWHYPHFSNQGGRPGGAVRSGDWKLIERYEDGHLELYNLATDPGERDNLARRRPAVAKRLLDALRRWRRSVGATMPPPNPRFSASPAGRLEEPLRALRAVAREGAGNSRAAEAWRKIVDGFDVAVVPALLRAMESRASPLAANWLQSAAQVLCDRALAAGKPLPERAFVELLEDRGRDPRARQLAFELLTRVRPAARNVWLPRFLEDPSVDLRREAVQAVMQEASQLEGDPAKIIYEKALVSARDDDQVREVVKALRDLGREVDVARHFGFVREWHLVGPFDNSDRAGFEASYPPEQRVDLQARYSGTEGDVGWEHRQTEDEYGRVDLNRLVGRAKSVLAYAYSEFESAADRELEIRVATANAWKLWVNGELYYARDEYHHGTRLDHYRVPVRLREGTNQILVKVCQNEQTEDYADPWRFQLRVCDATGTAVHTASDRKDTRPPAEGER